MPSPPPPRSPAVVAERLATQLLGRHRAGAVEEAVGRLLAVQAQDPRGARLALRCRTTGTTVADVDAALAERRLVVSWLNRGTLHLVRAEDEAWLHALTAPRTETANRRRLAQEGVSPAQAERGVAVVAAAVEADGPLTRAQLRDRLDVEGVPTAGQALVHVLAAATLAGHVVRGPMVGTEQAFVSRDAWLGPRPAVDRDEALATLARRYLAGHGPAAPEDLATWAGLPLGDARRAVAAIADDSHDRGDGMVALGPPPRRPPALPPPTLLGPFDPVLHGWASRREIVGQHQGVVTTNGLFRAVALVGGRAVATWRLAGGDLTVVPLEPVDPGQRRALEAEAADVRRFLGLPPGPVTWA